MHQAAPAVDEYGSPAAPVISAPVNQDSYGSPAAPPVQVRRQFLKLTIDGSREDD